MSWLKFACHKQMTTHQDLDVTTVIIIEMSTVNPYSTQDAFIGIACYKLLITPIIVLYSSQPRAIIEQCPLQAIVRRFISTHSLPTLRRIIHRPS